MNKIFKLLSLALLAFTTACGEAPQEFSEDPTEEEIELGELEQAVSGQCGNHKYGVNVCPNSSEHPWTEPRCNINDSGDCCAFPQSRRSFAVGLGTGWQSSERSVLETAGDPLVDEMNQNFGAWNDGFYPHDSFRFHTSGGGGYVTINKSNFSAPTPTSNTAPMGDFVHMWCSEATQQTGESYPAVFYRCHNWKVDFNYAKFMTWYALSPSVTPYPALRHVLRNIWGRALGLGQHATSSNSAMDMYLSRWTTEKSGWTSDEISWANNYNTPSNPYGTNVMSCVP